MSKIDELIKELEEEVSHVVSGYGFFPGGDPRTFCPDEDCTEEEVARHKADCAAWDKGEKGNSYDQSGKAVYTDSGKMVGHIQPSGYGTGVYTYPPDPTVVRWLELARDAKKEMENK